MQPWQAASWAAVSGASEAPKSTARALICSIPAPEPTAPYFTLTPVCLANSGAQYPSKRGAISVEPAPVSSAAPAWAGSASGTDVIASNAAIQIGRAFLRYLNDPPCFSSLGVVTPCELAAKHPLGGRQLCGADVKIAWQKGERGAGAA